MCDVDRDKMTRAQHVVLAGVADCSASARGMTCEEKSLVKQYTVYAVSARSPPRVSSTTLPVRDTAEDAPSSSVMRNTDDGASANKYGAQ